MHNVHWHGVVLNKENTFTDQFSLLASNTVSAELIADNNGVWLFHCHVRFLLLLLLEMSCVPKAGLVSHGLNNQGTSILHTKLTLSQLYKLLLTE